jgi:hypothetical protein
MARLDRISAGKRSSRTTVSHPELPEEPTGKSRRNIGDVLGQVTLSLLFFGFFFVWLWRVVDLRLIYSIGATTNFPVFFKGWDFFHDQMLHAGGAVSYVSALLSQFFYYSWAGALVVTLQAWLLAACTGYLLAGAGVPGARWLRFGPPLLVLAAYNQYSYYFPTTMAALTALLFACLYIAGVSRRRARTQTPDSAGKSRDEWALALFVALSVLVYPVAAGAYLLFGALCILYELLFHSRRVGLLAVGIVLVLPYVAAVWVFDFRVVDAYTELLPISWKLRGWQSRTHMLGTVHALYLLVPTVLLLWGLGRARFRYLRGVIPHGRRKVAAPPRDLDSVRPVASSRLKKWRSAVGTPAEDSSRVSVSARAYVLQRAARRLSAHRTAYFAAMRWTAQFLVVLGLAVALAATSHDAGQKTRRAVHYYACRRRWPEALQAAAGQPADPFVLMAVNRALYHTGRLDRDMFAFPQQPGALLPTGDDKVLVYWNKFDTLIDLGLMNLAEKNLTECMETFGAHPLILQRLALVNLATGKTATARVFLGALERTLFYSAWARHYLTLLSSDPELVTDPDIRRLRAVRLRTDSSTAFFDREKMLTTLLQDNGHNRMAFEYLMAWYMVTKQVAKVAEGIRYLDALDYREIPALYQQALCVYAYGQGKPLQLLGRTIHPQVQQQIEQFSQTFNRYQRDKRAAFPELAATYGGSYFLYHIYGLASLE